MRHPLNHPLLGLLLVVSIVLPPLAAQGPFPVGVSDLSFPNTSGSGTVNLACRVHYPADLAGRDVPVRARTGGWPTVVYLHGFAALGRFYGSLGDALAERGYIAVMSDTAQFANATQANDGRALFSALVAANSAVSGLLSNAVDESRIGLGGHSMGGGNVGNVLATEPRYRCGFAFAPVSPTAGNALRITQPLMILVGEGDTTTPWRSFSEPFYAGVTNPSEFKALYLLDGDADHTNVTGLFVTGGTGLEVFRRSVAVALGFFDRFLGDLPAGLEDAIGPAARSEPRLTELRVEVARPDAWTAAPIRVGVTTRVSIAAEPGAAGLLGAAGLGTTMTPFGVLGLDPASAFVAFAGLATDQRRFDAGLTLPADRTLIGARLPVQAYGAVRGAALWLGTTGSLEVVD